EVLEETCVIADQLAKSKHIKVKRQLHQEVVYLGDEAFLRELFLIFLENAIKYSPPNTQVHVAVEQNESNILVTFEDQGVGIEPEHIPHIFERFYRVLQESGGEARSGGLGLSIARVIVGSQNGRINCESIPGEGSRFTVSLPVPAPVSVPNH